MNRRDALKYTGLAFGYAATAGTLASMMQSCQADVSSDGWSPSTLSSDQVKLVAEVAETLIPATDTPGAKDVMVHRYIDSWLTGYLTEENRQQAIQSIETLEAYLNEAGSKKFADLSAEEQLDILSTLNKEAISADSPNPVQQAYLSMKGQVINTYFTSEKVGEEVLTYLPVPGPFQACIPYEEVGRVYSL
jgi:hypothetical protein